MALSAALPLSCLAMPAQAQSQDNTVLVDSSPLLMDYDRGRNVSVTQKPRPEYDALGVRTGAFIVLPRVGLSAGASDNVYLTNLNEVGDVFFQVAPTVAMTSDFSRHQLGIGAGASLRRYAEESARDHDEWYLNLLGRADIGSNFSLTGELQAAHNQESPFSGAIASDIAALSGYDRRTAVVRGQYTASRSRATLAYDFNAFEFDDIAFTSGARISQADRDRNIHRLTAQYEYATSPSFSVYGQVSVSETDYEAPLRTGQANRDSRAGRVIGGVKFDLSAFMRGMIGVGYLERKYTSPLYRDVGGISAEAQIEYFPTELTTATLRLRRILDDSSIGAIGAFFDNQVAVRIDHELRYNLLVNLNGAYTRQEYVDSPLASDIYRVGAGARYLLSPALQIFGNGNYSGRTQSTFATGGSVTELSAEVGIILQR